MAQLVSTAANSAYTEFNTKIPSIGDAADIVEAFRLYHYGKDNFVTGGAPDANSIHSHLESLRDDITVIQDSPGAGGVSNEVPHDLDAGAVKVDVPDGFIWVDGNATGSFNIEQGTVTFSNNPPTEYSHGLIWVDKDAPLTDPFNLDNFLTQSAVDLVYLSKSSASTLYATKVDYATKDVGVYNVTDTTFSVSSSVIYGILNVPGSSTTAIVVPLDSAVNFNIGASFSVLKTGSATITISGQSGVTVSGTPGTKLRTLYSFATCVKISANNWIVIGDTAVA
jgi:hypothetical protein